MADSELTPETQSISASSAFWGVVAEVQDRAARAFGVSPIDRETTVSGILARAPSEATGYWLQLILAMGIATLGLVLGSTAVVIGAMLISPLMGPIVELGMGLAVGSPLLVLRSVTRTVASIMVVIGSAALITLALPFQEVTPEIAARTSPTALDLLIAILCAIAAAYTTIRPGSSTTGTAAGTAIGIALVPPLCVVGYGIGTGASNISSGAGLLFTANFCAILLFAVLCFLALGYSRAQAAASEAAELERHGEGLIRRLTRGLRIVFGMKYGGLLRVLMPMFLLAFVAMPLSEALAHVTWQVRVRSSIQRILGTLPENTVRSSFSVERNDVTVRLFTLGRADEASKLEKDLTGRIAAIAGLVPKVQVIAVADSTALENVSAKLDTARPTTPVIAKTPSLDNARSELHEVLTDAWPSAAGKLLDTRISFPREAPIVVEVVHLGPKLGVAGEELLGERITRALGSEVAIRDVAISPEPVVNQKGQGAAFLRTAWPLLQHVSNIPGLRGCVETPNDHAGDGAKDKSTKEAVLKVKHSKESAPKNNDDANIAELLRTSFTNEGERIGWRNGETWRLVMTTEPCEVPKTPESAGAKAAGSTP